MTTPHLSLGLYTPDLPNAGCENRCFFRVRVVLTPIGNESVQAAWLRHKDRFLNFPSYVPDSTVVAYAHTVRTEPQINAQTWITSVFQVEAPAEALMELSESGMWQRVVNSEPLQLM